MTEAAEALNQLRDRMDEARARRDYACADEIRDAFKGMGFRIETRHGRSEWIYEGAAK